MSSIQAAIELSDRMSAPLYNICTAVNVVISGLESMRSASETAFDTSTLDTARQSIAEASAQLRLIEADKAKLQEPVTVPVQWQTDNLDVYMSAGMERFRQEIASANQMMDQLCNAQDQIARQAFNTMIFPPEAFQNLNSMAVRMDHIRERIQQLESHPVNIGTNTANAELEHLRVQLARMVEQQNTLNNAMQEMDVSAANTAYLQLSQTMGSTERYIRDNISEQEQFNQTIREGTSNGNQLVNSLKQMVAVYVSLQSLKKVLDLSDELTQTNARLGMMVSQYNELNGTMQTTEELSQMVYQSAQNSRASYLDTAASVAKLGNNARDAFSSTEEIVGFAELVNKQFTIAGASAQESSSAFLQLTQALGSGVLRGDELNSIFEQAPNIIQAIADYMDVPIGQVRELASEGQITADIVKNAMFAAEDEINAKFEEMPMTWGQLWTSFTNQAIMTFQPVLQQLNDIANSDEFQTCIDGIIGALAVVARIAVNVIDVMAKGGAFIVDNWSIISPIIYGVIAALAVYGTYLAITKGIELASAAASAIMTGAKLLGAAALTLFTRANWAAATAQMGLNASMYACPIVWIIILIIGLIAIIYAACSAIAKWTGVADSGFGVICGGINVVIQFFKNLLMTGWNISLGITNAIVALCSNIRTAFHNAICSVQAWWFDLLSTCLSVIGEICAALNKLPFVEFDYSGITSKADEYAAKSAEFAGSKEDYTSVSEAFNKGFNTFDTFQEGWASEAFDAGASRGDGVADAISNFFGGEDVFGGIEDLANNAAGILGGDNGGYGATSDVADNIAGIAGDTSSISDSLDVSEEDLKYLRDIAEQEAINRFTTASIHVDMSGMNNTVTNTNDLDGIVDGLTTRVLESMEVVKEGV